MEEYPLRVAKTFMCTLTAGRDEILGAIVRSYANTVVLELLLVHGDDWSHMA